MLTAYQTATAAARRAARLFLTHAIVCPGFTSPADLPGLGLYTCPATGLEIVLTRSGAVDSSATKARRIAKEEAAAIAADMAGRAMARRARLQEEAAAIDSQWPAADLPADFCADLESGPVGPDWKDNGPAESFYAQAPALPNGRPGPFAFGPTEEAARAALAALLQPVPAAALVPVPCPKAAARIATDKKAARRKALIAALVESREARAGRYAVTLAPWPCRPAMGGR